MALTDPFPNILADFKVTQPVVAPEAMKPSKGKRFENTLGRVLDALAIAGGATPNYSRNLERARQQELAQQQAILNEEQASRIMGARQAFLADPNETTLAGLAAAGEAPENLAKFQSGMNRPEGSRSAFMEQVDALVGPDATPDEIRKAALFIMNKPQVRALPGGGLAVVPTYGGFPGEEGAAPPAPQARVVVEPRAPTAGGGGRYQTVTLPDGTMAQRAPNGRLSALPGSRPASGGSTPFKLETKGDGKNVLAPGEYTRVKLYINSLKEVENILQTQNVTGPIIGAVPERVLPFVNQAARNVRDKVAQITQQNLRETLGGQFAMKEGEDFIRRGFDTSLDEEYNLPRVRAFREAMEAQMKEMVVRVTTLEEAKNLEPGQRFMGPDGVLRVRN